MAGKKKKFILGIDLGGTKILIGLFDRKFCLKKTVKLEMDGNRGERFFFNKLIDGIEEVLEETGSDLSDLVTIGVGCPGIIDIYKGIVKVITGTSVIKCGDKLGVNTTSAVVNTTTANRYILGTALGNAATSGDIIPVLLEGGGGSLY